MKKVVQVIAIILIIINIGLILLNSFNVLGYRTLKIVSGSMEKEISVNDRVIVKKDNLYTAGDIVTLKYDDIYVTHRVIKITADEVIAKGDANNTADNPTSIKNIVGKVVLVINGKIYDLLRIFCIIFCFILLYLDRKRRKVV